MGQQKTDMTAVHSEGTWQFVLRIIIHSYCCPQCWLPIEKVPAVPTCPAFMHSASSDQYGHQQILQ